MKPSGSLPSLIHRLIILFSSGFYTGYFPFASGTVATALALILYWPLERFNRLPSDGGNLIIYAAIVAGLFVAGVLAADYAEKFHAEKDPHKVVIDEIIGTFVTMTLVPFHWGWLIAAFFVFRFFDVLKPPPIRRLEKFKGGFGIMIDDVLAGIYACICLHAAGWLIRTLA